MDYSIAFPHLGVYLSHVGKNISIHGFAIAYYGIVIGLGIVAGVAIASMEAKRTGQNPDTYLDLAMYAVVIGVIGARAYYVAFSWEQYKGDILSIINLRQGGLAIYGGVIGAVLTVLVFSKVKKLSFGLLVDTAGMGLVTGQAIGRWGNFFNREAFGEYTDGLFAMKLPLSAVRAGDVTELMKANQVVEEGITYIQVHPTYLYESAGCLLILLLLLLFRYHKKFDGEMFLLYLGSYGFLRFFIERLRTDSLLLPGMDVKVSELLAATLFVVAFVWILSMRISLWRKEKVR